MLKLLLSVSCRSRNSYLLSEFPKGRQREKKVCLFQINEAPCQSSKRHFSCQDFVLWMGSWTVLLQALFYTIEISVSATHVPSSKQDNTEVDTNGLEQKYNCHPKREHRRLWSWALLRRYLECGHKCKRQLVEWWSPLAYTRFNTVSAPWVI